MAALYCSTTSWSFGPLFHDDEFGHDGRERAEAFLEWLKDYMPPREHLNGLGRLKGPRDDSRALSDPVDPRALTDQGLEHAFVVWLGEEMSCYRMREERSAG
jgi:hypothetical protein